MTVGDSCSVLLIKASLTCTLFQGALNMGAIVQLNYQVS